MIENVAAVKQLTGGALVIETVIVEPEKWSNVVDSANIFKENYNKLFKQIVFESHKYLIRVTPMQFGRLRAGWTSILKKFNIDYTSAFIDVSLLDNPHEEPLDQELIKLGESESDFEIGENSIMVVNRVPYAEWVEYGTRRMEGRFFTTKALYKSELIFKKAFDAWFKEIIVESDIKTPPPFELEDIGA